MLLNGQSLQRQKAQSGPWAIKTHKRKKMAEK
jgi:hypothetical protein